MDNANKKHERLIKYLDEENKQVRVLLEKLKRNSYLLYLSLFAVIVTAFSPVSILVSLIANGIFWIVLIYGVVKFHIPIIRKQARLDGVFKALRVLGFLTD